MIWNHGPVISYHYQVTRILRSIQAILWIYKIVAQHVIYKLWATLTWPVLNPYNHQISNSILIFHKMIIANHASHPCMHYLRSIHLEAESGPDPEKTKSTFSEKKADLPNKNKLACWGTFEYSHPPPPSYLSDTSALSF